MEGIPLPPPPCGHLLTKRHSVQAAGNQVIRKRVDGSGNYGNWNGCGHPRQLERLSKSHRMSRRAPPMLLA